MLIRIIKQIIYLLLSVISYWSSIYKVVKMSQLIKIMLITINDGYYDLIDNCPLIEPNPNQNDINGDGIGDVCSDI